MMSTELGACEWFVWDLRRSNLIDRGQLDQVISDFLRQHPGAEPPALSEYLVSQGILTDFQAERLLQGKTQGFVLGPYTLLDALGTGSMGTVYKASSKADDNWYAVKVLPRRSMWNVRLARRKVRAFEQCQHPTVVPFVDVGTSGGMHYLAWPLMEGETLESIVRRDGQMSTEAAAGLALQVAEGLAVVHKEKLFHGLLKPSNIMIGPEQQVYILDCGIGCLLAETEGESLVDTMSTANSVASGLDCASPESIMDPTNLTPIGDQYSLGCVLYFCLTGQFPFPEGTAVEKMMAHQTRQPEPLESLNRNVPEPMLALVSRLMEKRPEDRFRSTGEVIEALQPLAGVTARRPARVTGGPSSLRPASRREVQLPPTPPADNTPLPAGRSGTPTVGTRTTSRPVPPAPRRDIPRSPAADRAASGRTGSSHEHVLPHPPAFSPPPLRNEGSFLERIPPVVLVLGTVILCVVATVIVMNFNQ